MTIEDAFQTRISYHGDLKILLSEVCQDFGLGTYRTHQMITVGYEDLNIAVHTSLNSYLVKILAEMRSSDDRERYAQIMQAVSECEIAHPKLYQSDQGYLHRISIGETPIYLFVMQYINGASYYDLCARPSKQEIRFLAQQAALINKISIRPKYIYDDWAIVNFVEEYKKTEPLLARQDVDLIKPLLSNFGKFDLGALPHCFVHGDIIDTNVLRDESGRLWIIDFAVSNFNPRVQELAVFSCNLLFDPNRPDQFEDNFQTALAEYSTVIELTSAEIDALPVCITVAHAMHIIGATRSKSKGQDSEENRYWLDAGRKGLSFALNLWKQ